MKTPVTSFTRYTRAIGFALLCASSAIARAGTPVVDSKETKEPVPTEAEPWKFTLALPGWLANTSGTIGLDGVNSHVYVPIGDIIPRIDMAASVSAEARKGRFGIYADMLYLKLSETVNSDGLIGTAKIRLDQWLADLEVNYRVLEGPKGYLDLRAGVRYTDIYNKLTIYPNNSAIDAASTKLVDDIANNVKARLNELDIKSRLRTALEDRIRARITGRLDDLQANRPALPVAPLQGHKPTELDDIVRTAVDNRVDELAADLKAQLAATTAALKAAAQAKIDALKAQLASQIAAALKDKLNASATLNERWLDPYVGFAARYNLSKAWYLTGKGDIGGFGIGSEITWQAYGALGCNVSRWFYVEAGYRYLYTDYNQGGFLYDVTLSGAQITAGITF